MSGHADFLARRAVGLPPGDGPPVSPRSVPMVPPLPLDGDPPGTDPGAATSPRWPDPDAPTPPVASPSAVDGPELQTSVTVPSAAAPPGPAPPVPAARPAPGTPDSAADATSAVLPAATPPSHWSRAEVPDSPPAVEVPGMAIVGEPQRPAAEVPDLLPGVPFPLDAGPPAHPEAAGMALRPTLEPPSSPEPGHLEPPSVEESGHLEPRQLSPDQLEPVGSIGPPEVVVRPRESPPVKTPASPAHHDSEPVEVHIGTIEIVTEPQDPGPAASPDQPRGFDEYEAVRNFAAWDIP